MTLADQLQLGIAVLALPVCVYFIYMFGKPSERFWRTMFGVSLMLIAVAIFWAELSIVLYRVFGFDYTGRDIIRVGSQALTLIAMSLRTFVLHNAQKHDKTRRPHL